MNSKNSFNNIQKIIEEMARIGKLNDICSTIQKNYKLNNPTERNKISEKANKELQQVNKDLQETEHKIVLLDKTLNDYKKQFKNGSTSSSVLQQQVAKLIVEKEKTINKKNALLTQKHELINILEKIAVLDNKTADNTQQKSTETTQNVQQQTEKKSNNGLSVTIGNPNTETLTIKDVYPTNNENEDLLLMFNNLPIHFYELTRTKKLPNNISLKLNNTVYGNINMSYLIEKQNNNPKSSNAKKQELINYYNAVLYKLLKREVVENKLIQNLGSIGYLAKNVVAGEYKPQYLENNKQTSQLISKYKEDFTNGFYEDDIERDDRTQIRIFKIGSLEVLENSKSVKKLDKVDQYVLDMYYRNGQKVSKLVYGNIDFNKLKNDSEYKNSVANDLLSDSNIQTTYVGKIIEYNGSNEKDLFFPANYMINKNRTTRLAIEKLDRNIER